MFEDMFDGFMAVVAGLAIVGFVLFLSLAVN